ncbi:hypothetical protein CU669_19940 [Paramagnetospirillum kuznetsovii]|uniref:Antitoxin-like ribbon-helix-helix domain-containing protein n=1 Tax=Paramagnetospirillum kuznetsovii TaxID=2053833 RepID=A0A364NSV1_9PROT|nr:ribbon-helix-helix domain-containing protein [Paramagnetospirillum kuznetsovii]RAU20163.1 hypothetical protein CU669_19940 [Paramagnetospirillum kuznetsovii]
MSSKRASLTKSPLRRPGVGVVPAPVSSDDVKVATPKSGGLRERSAQQTIYINREAARQLKRMAIAQDCKVHDLMIEAINDLFAKNGLPQIAAA